MNTLKTILTATILLFALTSTQQTQAQTKEHKQYYSNGKLWGSGYLTADDKPTGEWKTYYENGNLQQLVNYKNGEPAGEAKFYYESGKIQQISIYKDGKLEGEIRMYSENGNLQQISNYKDGKLEGESRIYTESGKLQQILYYKAGSLEDTKWYYEDGREDRRRAELKAALEKYLVNRFEGRSIKKISITTCAIYIEYSGGTNFDEAKIPMSLKEIDKDGVMTFDDRVVEYVYSGHSEGDFYPSFQEFGILPEGRKQIEELMRSLSKDCKN